MSLIPLNYKPNTIRNIITAVMNQFAHIEIDIIKPGDTTNTIIKSITVPLSFGPVEKYQQLNVLNDTDPTAGQYYETLPKMSLNWSSITYNGERHNSTSEIRTWYNQQLKPSDSDSFVQDLQPVPYDLGFELYIRCQSISQFTQILENTLCYFDPNRHLRVKEFSFLNIERDIKLRNDGVSTDFLDVQEEDNRRTIFGSISMTAEAFLYTPLSDTKIIKEIHTRYYMSDTFTSATSANEGFNTSGWDSSASFPGTYDISGVAEAPLDFEIYIDRYPN